MAKYVFDSNIFINLQRRQPIDIYPSLWSKIGDLMENGTIISSQEVYDEIDDRSVAADGGCGKRRIGSEMPHDGDIDGIEELLQDATRSKRDREKEDLIGKGAAEHVHLP